MMFRLLVIVLLVTGSVTQAEIYRWVDEKGQVHYGDRPQQKQNSQQIKIKPKPASNSSGAPRNLQQEQQKFLRSLEAERQEREEQRARQAKQDEEKQKKCHKARDDLRLYSETNILYELDKNGQRRTLNDQEYKNVLAETQKLIDKYCN